MLRVNVVLTNGPLISSANVALYKVSSNKLNQRKAWWSLYSMVCDFFYTIIQNFICYDDPFKWKVDLINRIIKWLNVCVHFERSSKLEINPDGSAVSGDSSMHKCNKECRKKAIQKYNWCYWFYNKQILMWWCQNNLATV